jgi:succinoglycan biosynthesis transport protein ExoP
VDPGRVPAKPRTPNVPFYMALSVGAGLFLGCVGSVLLDVLDDKIKTVHEAEKAIGQSLMSATPLLGIVHPRLTHGGQDQPSSLTPANSMFVETVRGIRTALILPGGQDRSRVILLTSSIAQEGKTLLSINLAGVLAQSGHRVLLVDTDMRRGELGQRLNLAIKPGLSELLAGERESPDIDALEGQPFLDVLQGGRKPPNPSELLSLGILDKWISEWRKRYDFIVLDATPLLMITDALVVNRLADVTLLVARVGFTEQAQLRRAFGLLNKEGRKHRIEVVLNGICPRDQSYSEYFGD